MIQASETIGALAKALSAFQAECAGAGKGGKNPHLRNSYTRLEDAWNAAREPLTRHGLSLVQFPSVAPDGFVGVATRLLHASGEWMEAEQHMAVAAGKGTTAAQATGSAISYARRYAIMSVLGLPSVDDDGEGPRAKQPAQTKLPEPDPRIVDSTKALAECATVAEVAAVAKSFAGYPEPVKLAIVPAYREAMDRVRGAE